MDYKTWREAVTIDSDRLVTIMELQREFQETILGHGDLAGLPPGQRGEYFRTQTVALMFELAEASNEIAWKPWATSDHFNTKAYASEIIDAFHFLLNLAFLVDMSADELFEGYLQKQFKNRMRQHVGYDGVKEKCPSCRRSYDDAGVLCHPPIGGPKSTEPGWCQVYGELGKRPDPETFRKERMGIGPTKIDPSDR